MSEQPRADTVTIGAVTVGTVIVGAVNVGALLGSRMWFSCAETRTPSDLERSCADKGSLHAVLGASGVGSGRSWRIFVCFKEIQVN